jgi:hypothetical protein
MNLVLRILFKSICLKIIFGSKLFHRNQRSELKNDNKKGGQTPPLKKY